MSRLPDTTVQPEGSAEQATRRLIAVCATGAVPLPAGLRDEGDHLEVQVRRPVDLEAWRLHCDQRDTPLAADVDASTFTADWAGVPIVFSFAPLPPCPRCGMPVSGVRHRDCAAVEVAAR